MESDSARNTVRHALLRMVVVLSPTLGFGFLFFRSGVFDLRTMASQFLLGITIGIGAEIAEYLIRNSEGRKKGANPAD